MDDRDAIEELWPQLAALTRTLEGLDGTQVTVKQDAQTIVEALAEHQKRGGAVPWPT